MGTGIKKTTVSFYGAVVVIKDILLINGIIF
jgi:hypothetical protein